MGVYCPGVVLPGSGFGGFLGKGESVCYVHRQVGR